MEPSEVGSGTGVEPTESWTFAGWGTATRISDLEPAPARAGAHGPLLGAWPATAICGNDISSSCLYVSALCAAQAGPYAPLALALVVAVLYLFRSIYGEVGSAIRLNGGTYTVLLNTTNKRTAAAAACLTLLSYVATAVISAGEAMHYAHNLYAGLPVMPATVALLALFAGLVIIGIGESAVVAVGIFVFHLVSLTLLCVAGIITVLIQPELLFQNLATPPPNGIFLALFFGFSAAMLGISGFESSANFIEEQKTGVFPKTLRNMWLTVAVFNPLISLLSLGLLPLATIQTIPPDLLADMGEVASGPLLARMIAVDAVLVLSGAVLTSFVGVTGLVRRMALDRCLPEVLLAENRRGTNHWIILAFFVVCCSILWVTGGQVSTLAGVYTLSFLSVMALFAVGNILLKLSRDRLPRETRAGWLTVVLGLGAVLIGLVGNVLLDPTYVQVFGVYFAAAGAVVGVMFLRVQLLRLALFVVAGITDTLSRVNTRARESIRVNIERINSRPVVYFTRGDAPEQLNRAALYVLENEQTNRLLVVHVYRDEADIPPQLADHLQWIDRQYPELRIDLMLIRGTFGPPLVEALSQRLGVPKNHMFLGTPGDRFPHRLETLGGVRLIL